jgi:hypothetical protein
LVGFLKGHTNLMAFSPNDLARVLNAIGFGQQDEAVWNTDRAGKLKAGSGA